MAKKVTVFLVDDIDQNSVADETIEFGLDGITYELDLSSANAQKLRNELGKWIVHARQVNGGKRSPGFSVKSRAPIDRHQGAAIRDWARRNGHQISSRGRISEEIITAYNAKR
ncbi:MAG: histone-like nucleoid-structuring protein Lsr2 [Mycobacteriaceae bacterium]